MFTSLIPGLIVAAITILMLRFVIGFLLRPPGAGNLKSKLIRLAAHLSVRVERLWRNDRRSRLQSPEPLTEKPATHRTQSVAQTGAKENH
jgi:hypothetical protein